MHALVAWTLADAEHRGLYLAVGRPLRAACAFSHILSVPEPHTPKEVPAPRQEGCVQVQEREHDVPQAGCQTQVRFACSALLCAGVCACVSVQW